MNISKKFFRLDSLQMSPALIGGVLLVAVLAWVTVYAINSIHNDTRQEVQQTLGAVLDSTSKALNVWRQQQESELANIARSPRTQEFVQALLSDKRPEQSLLPPTAFVRPGTTMVFQGIDIIRPDGIVMYATDGNGDNAPSSLARAYPTMFKSAVAGISHFIPPVALSGRGTELTFFIEPVIVGNSVVAVAAARYAGSEVLSRITYAGRIGLTGETYLINEEGSLLTQSRFNRQLQAAGLLDAEVASLPMIVARDPGEELGNGLLTRAPSSWPLTFAARQSLSGEEGHNLAGYRNYLGVEVVGAWRYLDEFHTGIITELQKDEAYAAYYSARLYIIGLSIFATLLALCLGGYITVLHLRQARQLKDTAKALRSRVTAKTKDLSAAIAKQEQHQLLLRTILDTLPDPVFCKQSDGTFLAVNKAFSQLHDISPDAMVGASEQDYYPEDEVDAFRKADQSLLDGNETLRVEKWLKHVKGKPRYYETIKVPVTFPGNDSPAILGISRDITIMKSQQTALQSASESAQLARREAAQQEQRFRSLVANLPGVVFRTALDDNWNMRYVSAHISRLTGYPPHALVGENAHRFLDFIHPDDRPGLHDTILKRAGKNTFYSVEYRIIDTEGMTHWIEERGHLFHENNERFIDGVMFDISAQKQLQQDFANATTIAQQANEAKSEFLARMSHEIRTPMNGVLGMLTLIGDAHLSRTQRHQLDVAQSSGESLMQIINDILDFSKVEAGKLNLEQVDFDIRLLVEDTARSLAVKADEKGLDFNVDVTGMHDAMVIGDPGRIRQVLTNLLSNAIKFTGKGEILVQAQMQGTDDLLQFDCKVTDSGIGIPANVLSTLFEPFSQVDSSTTRVYGGTGLGLAICKTLVELMGGAISVTSDEGEGTCFAFSLKLRKSHKSRQVLPQISIRHWHIVVVDDNATNREILQTQLSQWGAQVTAFANADDALNFLASQRPCPDLLISDLYMPHIDGIMLVERARQFSHCSELRALILSSVSHNRTADFQAAHINGCLIKPVHSMDLLNTLALISQPDDKTRPSPLVTENVLLSYARAETSALQWPDYYRIVVVEDNPVNAMVAIGLLEKIGLRAERVENGLMLLSLLSATTQERPVTLILMDIQMPVMGGLEATRQIREGAATERYRKVPIVAMTANALKGDREKCLAAGMQDYIAKPIVENELEKALHHGFSLVPAALIEHAKMPPRQERILTSEQLNLPDSLASFAEDSPPVLADQPTLYLRSLTAFLNQFSEYRQAIQSRDGEWQNEELEAFVHTLKGSSGNLGFHRLYEYLKKAEQRLNNLTFKQADLDQLLTEMDIALDDAKAILQANRHHSEPVRADKPFSEIRREVIACLERSEWVPEELMAEFRGYSAQTDGQKLNSVVDYITSFEYEKALDVLSRM